MKKHPWLMTVAVCAALLVVLFLISPFIGFVGEICSKNEYTSDKECASYHLAQYAILWIAQILDAHNGFVTALASVAVAWFTATLYWASVAQGRLTQQSIDDGRKSSERQLRAYLLVASGEACFRDDLLRVQATVKIRNSGQTPAHSVKQMGALRIGEAALENPFEGEEIFDQSTIVAPGGEFFIDLWANPSAEGPPNENRRKLFVIGQLDYLDAFEVPRRTQFRFEIVRSGAAQKLGLRPCREGNDAT